MMTRRPWAVVPIALMAALCGCGDPKTSPAPLQIDDAGAEPDAGLEDDAGDPDAGDPDAGDPDSGEPCVPVDEAPDGGDLPEIWRLEAEGISVEVRRSPLSWEARDGAGAVVLRTLGAGSGDGYGALAWTGGSIQWRPGLSPGYFNFNPRLEPWRDGWVVVGAEEDEGLTLTLQGPDPAAEGCRPLRVEVRFEVRPSALRVEASLSALDGAPPTPRAWGVAFESPEDEGFLGFGERFNRTNQRGVDVYNFAEEGGIGTGEGDLAGPRNPIPNGEAMAYYPVPFFMSTRGYGFWFDTTWRNEFNLTTERPEAWRAWHIGTRLAFEVYTPIPDDPRPWPHHLLDRFTGTVGRPMLPPAWTFGPRRRINRRDMQGGVHELEAMRQMDLAITSADDAMHVLPRGSHVGIEDELRAWTAFGDGLGYRMNCYYNALLDMAEDNPLRAQVERAIEEGWFIKNASGDPSEVFLISGTLVTVAMVDFTNPEATSWYQQELLPIGVDLGYSGWMYDFGEYVQPLDVAANGMLGEEVHNLYPVLYQKAAWEHMEAGPLAGQWLSFARSGYTGAWQYSPMVWSGDPAASFEDSDGLPSMIRAGVNLGLSGAPHSGGDINGFHCIADGAEAADEELLVRWIQQGSMSSNMQDQDACVQGGGDRKASIFDAPAATEAWRTYARLHTRLLPYLMTLAHEATATGAPTMRHLFFEHPDEPRLASVDDTYYFGPALLVAPVIERGARTRRVPLPSGRFLFLDEARAVDIAEVVEGAPGAGDAIEVEAPLALLPLFVRDGGLIPLLDPTIDTLDDREEHPEVVGPDDVADVYDVLGYLTIQTGRATFALHDGDTLSVTWGGGLDLSALVEARDEAELSTCLGCYLREPLSGGLERLRLSMAAGDLQAGGLTLWARSARRIRWDLYLDR